MTIHNASDFGYSIAGQLPGAEPRTDAQLEELCRGSIERYLGDVTDSEASEDTIYDEAYTLGFDALADAGVDHAKAREIAGRIAQCFAQP